MSNEFEATIDQIGDVDAKIKSLKKTRGELVETIAGLDAGKHSGLSYVATIVEKIDWRLDTKALKEEMGEPWYNQRCKQALSRSVRVKAL